MAHIDRSYRLFRPRLGRIALLAVAWLCCLQLCGCLRGRPGDGVPDAGEDPSPGTSVAVGVPDDTGTGFVALGDRDTVPVETYGQGGNHVVFSIACTGFGNAIYPQIVIENLDDGAVIETPPYVRPQPVACDVEGVCVNSQVFVMLGGLAEVEALDGLPVRVTARVSNEAGLMDEGSVEVVLRME